MYAIYANIWGILMLNVTIYIYSIHESYGCYHRPEDFTCFISAEHLWEVNASGSRI